MIVTIINMGHPLKAEHIEQILEWTCEAATPDVRVIKAQADNEAPFSTQAKDLVKACGLTPEEWQTKTIVLIPPGLAPLALCVMAEIHGVSGHFKSIVRMKPLAGVSPPTFVPAELVDLHLLRNLAREQR